MLAEAPSWLLLLHGFTGHPDSWQPVRRHLTSTLPVFAPALLGHAANGADSEQVESFDAELERLAAWLQQRTNVSGHLCGYSLGARVGLGLLVRFPELFTSATLIGINPGLASEAERATRRERDAHWQRMLRHQGLEAFIDTWQQQALFATQSRLPAAVLEHQATIRKRHDPEGLARSFNVLGLAEMPDYSSALRGVVQPVELFCGALDARFVGLAERMSPCLPRSRVVRVPGCGHNLPLEAPDAVARALDRALSQKA